MKMLRDPALPASPLTLRPARVHEVQGPGRRAFGLLQAARLKGPVLWIMPAHQPEGPMLWGLPEGLSDRLHLVRAKGEPDGVVARGTVAGVDFGKAGEGHKAAVRRAQPAPPMRRGGVADVGHTRIGALAFQKLRRGRHAPARQRQPPSLRRGGDDRGGMVGEDAGHRWQIARVVDHHVKDMAHGVLTAGLRV